MGYSRKRRGSEDSLVDEIVTKKSKGSGDVPSKQKDADGNPYWEISGKRRLQISEFKNMTMVNIREFYEKDGKALPGKAGINLPLEQFTTFLSLLPQVLKELESRGHTIEMPSVDRGSTSVKKDDDEVGGEEEETEKAEKAKKSTKSRKSNIEATSDEEEDE